MDITPFVESLRRDLGSAADAAGPDGHAAAERMLLALEPAVRLAVMEALSQAAAEITAELPAGLVEVRLRGRDPELVVDVPAASPPTSDLSEPGPAVEADADEEEDEGMIARVTLRIPESVKTRAEEIAARSGHSLNGWIVTVLRAATSQKVVNVDLDLSSVPFFDDRGPRGGRSGGRRMRGWA
jgi:hypothetical protein